MKFLRKHIVSICAVLALVAVGGYEGYWISHMYAAETASVKSSISSSLTLAEVDVVLDGINRQLERQDTVFLTSLHPSVESKIVSMSVGSVKLYKLDDPGLSASGGTELHDVEKVQEALRSSLKEAGLDIDCRLVYEQKADSTGQVSGVEAPQGGRTGDKVILTVPSSVTKGGQYQVLCSSFPGFIARRMAGITAISAGILLIIALSFMMLDLADRKRRHLDEMKNDFTRNITHELKTPLAVAYAANDALLECGLGEDPSKREKYLQIIKSQLDTLGGMVETILSTTAERRSGVVLDCARTPLRPMLEEAASQTRLKAGKECEISVSVTPDSLEADIDRRLMFSVVMTILDNAVKYSYDSVKIALEAHASAGKTLISITDNGIGIAPSDQKHVFEKFFRAPTGDRHDVKGYGLGLFFARSIVERHGGKISVESRSGKGSSFVIAL